MSGTQVRPVPPVEGAAIVLAGAAMMALLEGEKWLLRKLDLFEELRAAADVAAPEGATA